MHVALGMQRVERLQDATRDLPNLAPRKALRVGRRQGIAVVVLQNDSVRISRILGFVDQRTQRRRKCAEAPQHVALVLEVPVASTLDHDGFALLVTV